MEPNKEELKRRIAEITRWLEDQYPLDIVAITGRIETLMELYWYKGKQAAEQAAEANSRGI